MRTKVARARLTRRFRRCRLWVEEDCMNRVANSFIVFVLAFCAAASCAGQSTPQSCPVSYSRLQMPLRHRGGMSTPMVQLSFTNETKKKMDRAKFGLIVI